MYYFHVITRLLSFFPAKPMVKKFHKSKNLVQGESLELHCVVYSYPSAWVKWYRTYDEEGEDYKPFVEDPRITVSDLDDTVNGTLIITNLDFPDRAYYMCVATNDIGSGNSTTLVRVKGE